MVSTGWTSVIWWGWHFSNCSPKIRDLFTTKWHSLNHTPKTMIWFNLSTHFTWYMWPLTWQLKGLKSTANNVKVAVTLCLSLRNLMFTSLCSSRCDLMSTSLTLVVMTWCPLHYALLAVTWCLRHSTHLYKTLRNFKGRGPQMIPSEAQDGTWSHDLLGFKNLISLI